MDERSEELITMSAAISAAQQLLIERLIDMLPNALDANIERAVGDVRAMLAATRRLLRSEDRLDRPERR